MKNILKYVLLFTISCTGSHDTKMNYLGNNNINLNEKTVKNIYKYLDDSSNKKYHAFVVRVLSYSDETIIGISPIKSTYILMQKISSLYINYKDKHIFFYLGIESIVTFDTLFLNKYYQKISSIELQYELSKEPLIFDPYPFYLRIRDDSIFYNDKSIEGSIFLSPSSKNKDPDFFLPTLEDTMDF